MQGGGREQTRLAMGMPPANDFLVEQATLVQQGQAKPELVASAAGGLLFNKADPSYHCPKAFLKAWLISGHNLPSSKYEVLRRLAETFIESTLKELLQAGLDAGI